MKPSIGYLQLLKQNRKFRNLWYGQVVSELGDWLNSIAIYVLILKLTGSGMAMAAAMMAKLLPMVVVSPLAGVVIDRISRKKVMIVSDILRFFVVLGFLLVEDKNDLWLIYALAVLEVTLAGFFEPARSAIIPSIVQRNDLVTANALGGSTWSMMLAFGAAIGGFVVSLVGVQAAFVIDACTFLVSAWFISRLPAASRDDSPSANVPEQGGFKDLIAGAKYLLSEPIVLSLSLLKSGLAIAGGIMTLVPLYAHQLLTTPESISMGIGIMFASRGIGAALGPILVKYFFGDSARVLRISISSGFFLGSIALFMFSGSQTLLSACITIGLAMMCGSVIWVFSSALIHLEADERFLGRIFGTEMAILTLVMGISNGMVGWAIDGMSFSPNEVAMVMAGCYFIPGILWSGFLLFVHHRLKQGKCIGSVCPVDPSGVNPPPGDTI